MQKHLTEPLKKPSGDPYQKRGHLAQALINSSLASEQLSKQVTGDTGAAKHLVFSVREEHQADTIAKRVLEELVISSAQMRLVSFTAKGKAG